MNPILAGTCTGECAEELRPIVGLIMLGIFLVIIAAIIISIIKFKNWRKINPNKPIITKKRVYIFGIVLAVLVIFWGLMQAGPLKDRAKRNRMEEYYQCKEKPHYETVDSCTEILTGPDFIYWF